MSPSGESIQPAPNADLPLGKEQLVLDSRLPLEPPDLIPKLANTTNEPQSHEYSRNYQKYRLLPTSFNPRIGSGHLGLAEITNVAEDPPDKFSTPLPTKQELNCLYESNDIKKCDAFSETQLIINQAQPVKCLESQISNSPVVETKPPSPPDVTRTRRLVERSTSFGRDDVMKLVEVEVVAEVDGEVDDEVGLSDAASQTEIETQLPQERHTQEEEEVERLSRDLASQLSPSDKLISLLGMLITIFTVLSATRHFNKSCTHVGNVGGLDVFLHFFCPNTA